MKRVTFSVVAALSCFAAGVHSAAAGRYVVTGVTITDLGTLGGLESVANDINDLGVVVGWSHTVSGLTRAFQFRAGAFVDLGGAFGANETTANGINIRNEVVGTWWMPGRPNEPHGVYWNGGGFFLPDVIDPDVARECQYGSSAFAINDTGIIAGQIGLTRDLDPANTRSCYLSGFNAARWTATHVPSLLFHGPQPNVGYDINNPGSIVGKTKTNAHELFSWAAGVVTGTPAPPMPPDGYYGGGAAHGVNNHGQVVGYLSRAFRTGTGTIWRRRAFLAGGAAGPSIELGTLPTGVDSVAREINDQGFVAGYGDKVTISVLPRPSSFVRNAGLLWHSDFGIYALPRLPMSGPSGECEAYALNNRKTQDGSIQVVGYCTSNGRRHAVRWDVTTTVSTPVCPTPTC